MFRIYFDDAVTFPFVGDVMAIQLWRRVFAHSVSGPPPRHAPYNLSDGEGCCQLIAPN
jgi:hypothetical protein